MLYPSITFCTDGITSFRLSPELLVVPRISRPRLIFADCAPVSFETMYVSKGVFGANVGAFPNASVAKVNSPAVGFGDPKKYDVPPSGVVLVPPNTVDILSI